MTLSSGNVGMRVKTVYAGFNAVPALKWPCQTETGAVGGPYIGYTPPYAPFRSVLWWRHRTTNRIDVVCEADESTASEVRKCFDSAYRILQGAGFDVPTSITIRIDNLKQRTDQRFHLFGFIKNSLLSEGDRVNSKRAAELERYAGNLYGTLMAAYCEGTSSIYIDKEYFDSKGRSRHILLHELSHAILSIMLRKINETYRRREEVFAQRDSVHSELMDLIINDAQIDVDRFELLKAREDKISERLKKEYPHIIYYEELFAELLALALHGDPREAANISGDGDLTLPHQDNFTYRHYGDSYTYFVNIGRYFYHKHMSNRVLEQRLAAVKKFIEVINVELEYLKGRSFNVDCAEANNHLKETIDRLFTP